MTIDQAIVITELDGTSTKNVRDEPLTIGEAIGIALVVPDEATSDQKYDLFKLAIKLHNTPGEVELTPEECVLIKTRVGRYFGPLVVGRIYDLIG